MLEMANQSEEIFEHFQPKEKTNPVQTPQAFDDTLVFDDLPTGENKTEIQKPLTGKTRKIKPIGYVLMTLIGFLVVVGLIWGISRAWIKEEIAVPDIIELPAAEAQRILAAKDLKMVVEKEIFHAQIPKEHIISQDPLPDTLTKSGRTIQVVVSKGHGRVPKVISSSQIIADVNITNADLILGEIDQQYSSQYANGCNRQYPEQEQVPENRS